MNYLTQEGLSSEGAEGTYHLTAGKIVEVVSKPLSYFIPFLVLEPWQELKGKRR